MSGNPLPQFGAAANVSAVLFTPSSTANTSSAGGGTIGTDIFVAFTAGSNGSYVDSCLTLPVSAVAEQGYDPVAVLRLFLSSKTSGATSSADTWLLLEENIGFITIDSAQQVVGPGITSLNLRVPAGYAILATLSAAPAANCNMRVVVSGSDY